MPRRILLLSGNIQDPAAALCDPFFMDAFIPLHNVVKDAVRMHRVIHIQKECLDAADVFPTIPKTSAYFFMVSPSFHIDFRIYYSSFSAMVFCFESRIGPFTR
jgi:hypothetical protein